MTKHTYFAAAASKDVGNKLWARYEKCLGDENDMRWQYANAYEHYYGTDAGAGIPSGITRGGDEGELASIRVNNARALADALHALVTAARVTWRPKARNGDSGAAKATTLATNLLEDAWTRKRVDRTYSKWVAEAIRYGRSFTFPEWDMGLGPPLAALDGQLQLQGDIHIHNVPPWRVHTDNSRASWEEEEWFYVRLYKSRWTLAKLHRALADGRSGEQAESAILDAKADERTQRLLPSADTEHDVVPVVYFFHKPTPTLPAGRLVKLLSADVVLQDVPLLRVYDEVPLYPLSLEDMTDSPHAVSRWWDTLGPQELMDGIHTTLATIITTLGNTCVAVPKGAEEKPDVLAKGFRKWEYPRDSKPPSPIQLAQFPPDALKYEEVVAGKQQQLMGLNDVALGQPQSAQMNAQAFAVLASMAVQQASPIQAEAVGALGRLGSAYLRVLRRHVSAERVLEVTGKQNKHLVSETRWTGSDLGPVLGVEVDIGNPMEQTAQGRLALLDIYRQAGLVTTAEEVQQVVETGRIEPATRAVRDELQLIRTENEALQGGESPVVDRWDNHLLHYREHAAVRKNGEARKSPALVEACETHNAAHYLEFFGVEPEADPLRAERERFLLGIGPPPMPAPPPGAPGEGGPAEALAPPGALPVAESAPAPAPPDNPVTGAPFNPVDGGGVAPLPQ